LENFFAYTGLLGIVLTIICIGLSWWAIQAFRFDLFTANPKGPQAKALQIILAVVLGYQLASFLLDYFGWTVNLRNFF